MKSIFRRFISGSYYACSMWACHFWQALKVHYDALQKMQLCNVLIDVKVGFLLTFFASMKAKVYICIKVYVSIFGCLHTKSQPFFKYPFSRSQLRSPDSSLHFEYSFSSFVCIQKAKTVTKCSFFLLKTESCKCCQGKKLLVTVTTHLGCGIF